MRLSTAFAAWMSFASVAAMSGHAPAAVVPVIFAPGAIPAGTDDGAAAFTPDGVTVYFTRATGDGSTLMESRRRDGHWSTPTVAPFSGHWHDLDPAMAPDGSFLLFASNRPATPGDPPLDAVHGGKRHVAQGMNLWRVDWQGDHWGAPVRLPDVVNRCSLIASPSIAADGSLYFIGCDGPRGDFALLRSAYRDGQYETPRVVALGDAGATIRDPAIAPDGSFIVVSIKHAPQAPYRLAIAFRTPEGWSAPQDLGDTANGGTENMGAQLGPDHRTLYFYSDRRAAGAQANAVWNNGHDHIWQLSLAPWLDAHAGRGP